MKKSDFLQHIQGEEQKKKLRILLDKIESSRHNQRLECTDFLDPYEVDLSKGILNHFDDINYFFSNGLEFGERKVGLIFPSYFLEANVSLNDFISAVRLQTKGVKLSHSDFLGALMHLGVSRDKLGDIFPVEDGAYVLTTKPIASLIITQLNRVRNIPVKSFEICIESIEYEQENSHEVVVSVASLRVDLIISSAFHLSREESARMISSGLVKVQWRIVQKKDHVVSPGQMISVRRYGRIYFQEVLGVSSKGKTRIRLSII